METLFHFVIEDTTRQFSTSATFKISDKISSPMENIYIYIYLLEKIESTINEISRRNRKYFPMFLSPHLFSIHHLFLFIFFLAPKIISPPAEKPLLLFLVLLFILVLVKIEREGSRFYRVALSNENKNKIYLSSGLLLLLLLFARVTCPFLFRFLIESNYYVTRAWNFSNFTADFGHTCN